MQKIGWLFLFTFGLTGVRPLFVSSYYENPLVLYAYTACGLAAIAASLYTMVKVGVIESLNYRPWKEIYNKVPLDVRALALFIFVICTLAKLNINLSAIQFNVVYFLQALVTSTVLVLLTMVQIIFLYDVIREPAEWNIAWRGSVMVRCACAVRDSFLYRSLGLQLFWTLGVFFASGFGLMVALSYSGAWALYVPLFVIFTVPTLIAACRRAGRLNRITENTSMLVAGLMPPDLAAKGSSTLAKLAGNVNRLKRGVELSQAAQAKSERLKTDLITNVSHDLRTPLTSIITYTELLKQPDLDEQDRAAYVDVIDQKSQRLKILIDDLFEASKMASGNVELVKERIDITQLLQQTLAERDEAIVESHLDVRVSKPAEPVYCVVDGQKMWRVFDNLIGNILKYSLPHTRVYISVETNPSTTTLIFKNIAKYELNGDIDELFERFKRGDESRHTEGSGLGLAIAKSIVDLHDGSLQIGIDGDLFKAAISLPNGN